MDAARGRGAATAKTRASTPPQAEKHRYYCYCKYCYYVSHLGPMATSRGNPSGHGSPTLMRHVSLSETESNPWLPDVALGEVRDALEGTVEEWLTRAFADPADLVMPAELVRFLSDKGAYHSIDRLNDNEVCHGADFLRAAVELVDGVSTIAVSGIVSTPGLDSAALFWLWQHTELLHRKARVALTWH